MGSLAPKDYVVRATPGADFGFPSCNWVVPAACGRFTKPFAFFPPHASPMGLATVGGRLYVALYGGVGAGPEVIRMPVGGGRSVPFATGFTQPVLAVGEHRSFIYTGDLSGAIYRVG